MTTAMQTILLHDRVDEDLAAHFAALGVGTISAYKLWCYRHGLSKALDKTAAERAAERAFFASLQALVDPEASKEHDPRRARVDRAAFSRRVGGGEAQRFAVAVAPRARWAGRR